MPIVFSRSIVLPIANRRDSPSDTVTSHSPLKTINKVRADEVCQSLVQPAGASINLTWFARVISDRFKGGAASVYSTAAKPISTSSKCDSPDESEYNRVKVNMIQPGCSVAV